ncbi:AMP-binding protein [Streptomyces sp. NPDC050610]|uniref:AMP-binding protein n=1 Tax=Streptomyces sp. NPDC050610 TaxID=3157097 RepID=UPI00342A2E71
MRSHPLLDRLTSPNAGHGIRFYESDDGGCWRFRSYADLARSAFALAGRLRDLGTAPGDTVVTATGSGPEFVAAFLGATALGATPAPLAPPLPLQDPQTHRRLAERMVETVRPSVVVTLPRWEQAFSGLHPQGTARPRLLTVTDAELSAAPRAPQTVAAPPRRALVQFTSGSSGPAKAVTVSADALDEQLTAVRRWLRMEPDDATATWLPFHHDMGLVGCLLTPLSAGSDLWVMRPEDFVRSPLAWLRCFGSLGARLTSVPPLGLAHVVRRVRPESLEGLDFSEWRAVITGAERIPPQTLRAFTGLLAPKGFSSRALLPAYGLAEATLAVTGSGLDDAPRTLAVDRRSLAPGRRVLPAGPAEHALEMTGCGRPLVRDTAVLVHDESGQSLPASHVGEIVVTGPSHADVLRTGDSGFLHDGELFVVGRLGDSVKCRGATLFAEDLEESVLALSSLRGAGVAVLLGSRGGIPAAVAVVERPPGPWTAEVVRRLRQRETDLDVAVVTGPRGTILRTSSGKPRRRAMWRAHLTGALGHRACPPIDPDAHGPPPDHSPPDVARPVVPAPRGPLTTKDPQMHPTDDPPFYQVVRNSLGQHAVWPAARPLPDGWRTEGTVASREECLRHVEQVWPDIRPAVVRAPAGPGEARP